MMKTLLSANGTRRTWKNKAMKVVYKCDPEKNRECRKTSCQGLCFMTSNREYSIDGIPMVFDEEAGEFVNADQRKENLDSR